jgi:mRNA interferase YafQ
LLELKRTSKFKKELKRVIKQKLPIDVLDEVILTLRKQEPLDPKYRDHKLTGNLAGFRECHLLPDWLLIYYVDKDNLILTASRTGSHSELFK